MIDNTTTLVSVTTDGTVAFSPVNRTSVSNDGRFVTFTSNRDALVSADTNATYDVFLRDSSAVDRGHAAHHRHPRPRDSGCRHLRRVLHIDERVTVEAEATVIPPRES